MGFSQKGMFLSRNMKDTLVVLEIRKDRKYGSKDGIRFTINVGISVSALHRDDVAFGDASGEKIPTPEMCHWRQRLGHITQAHRDVWWIVNDDDAANAVCEEIFDSFVREAFPKIESAASVEALLQMWQEGRGPGLPEYLRRLELARLLFLTGRLDEARIAVQALEDASIGKAWGVSARVDVKAMRARIDTLNAPTRG